jgi:archaemetzincin
MMDVRVLPPFDLAQTHVTTRRNPWTHHVQLLTGDILDVLNTRLPNDAFALLGITMADLYPDPNWNFVFGQASLRERVGIYSFARHEPKFSGETPALDEHKVILRRSCKVLVHETAHMFGIEHCIWYRYLMNGSNHLAEPMHARYTLCPVDLRKLQVSVEFDPLERYRRLAQFDRQAGFDDEVSWLEKRIRFITSTTPEQDTP